MIYYPGVKTGERLASDQELRHLLSEQFGLANTDILSVEIVKEAVDARSRPPQVVYALRFELCNEPAFLQQHPQASSPPTRPIYTAPKVPAPGKPARIVVVGAGPAGLFCAYILALAGHPPLIIERGKPVEERVRDVAALWQGKKLNPESNPLFGEGGAGTFSDGKLFTRKKDIRIPFILQTFIDHGADPRIRYVNNPHVGTDQLRKVIVSLRKSLQNLGCTFQFNSCLEGVQLPTSGSIGLQVSGKNLAADHLVLAIGHSARDTYRMLAASGLQMKPKPFAVGVRVEHPRALIDQARYGGSYPSLGAAEYRLAVNFSAERAVYSFCMCPGGQVILTTNRPGELAVNGMSAAARSSRWSNAALVAKTPQFSQPLAGIAFQEEIERKAAAAGNGLQAPAQRIVDFLADRPSVKLPPSSYRPSLIPARLDDILPTDTCYDLRRALTNFARKIPGFCGPEGLLIAPETRTSAPLFMERAPKAMHACGYRQVFPCGEGAGYAGGITSSAIDGIAVATALLDGIGM